jgi:uncharacterized protein YciI
VPLFVLYGLDAAPSLPLRMTHRPAHLAGLQALDREGRLRFAGPMLDDAGNPCGSVVIFEARDLAAARALVSADPYLVHGVFASHELRELRQVFPAPP